MKLDRQRVKNAAKGACGFFVGYGFVDWLTNNPFSPDKLPLYAGYFLFAAVLCYFWFPALLRAKPD
jgi:hypothetical protein